MYLLAFCFCRLSMYMSACCLAYPLSVYIASLSESYVQHPFLSSKYIKTLQQCVTIDCVYFLPLSVDLMSSTETMFPLMNCRYTHGMEVAARNIFYNVHVCVNSESARGHAVAYCMDMQALNDRSVPCTLV